MSRLCARFIQEFRELAVPGSSPVGGWALSPNAAQLKLIMKLGVAPDSMKPGFQRVGATSNRGFMSFRRLRDTPVVVLARSV